MVEPTFEIFKGVPGSIDVLWVKAVRGLANARDEMKAIATEKPSCYFVFYVPNHSVLAAIDTTAAPQAKAKTNAA